MALLTKLLNVSRDLDRVKFYFDIRLVGQPTNLNNQSVIRSFDFRP